MKPAKLMGLIKRIFQFHNHRIYLGDPNESESWLQYASIAFQCDPEQLRKDIIIKPNLKITKM